MDSTHAVAWAAGLFEGEGTFILRKDGNPQAALGMRDKDVVERFAGIVGFGSVHEQERPENHSNMWYWSVHNSRDIRQLVEWFMPYLGERRAARGREILAATENWHTSRTSKYKTHCIRGHEFTDANTYRKKPTGTRGCRECQRMRARGEI